MCDSRMARLKALSLINAHRSVTLQIMSIVNPSVCTLFVHEDSTQELVAYVRQCFVWADMISCIILWAWFRPTMELPWIRR